MSISSIVAEGAAAFDIHLGEEALSRLEIYASCLLEWNEKMNLTAITRPEEVAVKHFVDSIALLSHVDIPQGGKMVDIGTGAGFPGVPVLIARPDIRLTLLDSLNKRLVFLRELLERLDLTAQLRHCRAEEGGRTPELREQFDLATSRAVANLRLLAEYCLPYVKVGGVFAAMKGPDVDSERKEAENAIRMLGGKIVSVNPFSLPDGSGHTVILIQKEKQTPDIYPRHGSQISKKPL